jgi:hypothetical protein
MPDQSSPILRSSDPELGPRLVVDLEPVRRAVEVTQAINSPQVILRAYEPTQFLTPSEARAIADALTEAATWQETYGPIERKQHGSAERE